MNNTERALLAALTDISGIGDARAYELYAHVDNPVEIIDPPRTIIDEFHYVDSDTYAAFQALDDTVDRYRRQFKEYTSEGITVLGIEDSQYPDPIRDGPAPVILYAKGNLNLLTQPTIGVSGSRETNDAGQEWIHSLSADLVKEGYIIVSGGAQGADTAAHQGALESTESTIAVLGTGVNVAYPPENEPLFVRILEDDGLFLSMRPPEATPTRHSFLNRNELIAALSDGMIFVATDGTGGTMSQYKIATEQQRDVFVPDTGLGVEPSEGLITLREKDETVVINTISDLLPSLSTTESRQSNLDNWR